MAREDKLRTPVVKTLGSGPKLETMINFCSLINNFTSQASQTKPFLHLYLHIS